MTLVHHAHSVDPIPMPLIPHLTGPEKTPEEKEEEHEDSSEYRRNTVDDELIEEIRQLNGQMPSRIAKKIALTRLTTAAAAFARDTREFSPGI